MEQQTPKTLEQQLKEKQKEIDELKKKLEDRNPAFNGNLLIKSDNTFKELCRSIGKAINQCLGQEYTHMFKGKSIRFEYESTFGGSGGWTIYLDNKSEDEIKNKIANVELRKFQDSLDNFAWAVENIGGRL